MKLNENIVEQTKEISNERRCHNDHELTEFIRIQNSVSSSLEEGKLGDSSGAKARFLYRELIASNVEVEVEDGA